MQGVGVEGEAGFQAGEVAGEEWGRGGEARGGVQSQRGAESAFWSWAEGLFRYVFELVVIGPVICSRVIADRSGLFLLGKKLALMEMRIMIILLLLSFELKEVPDPLGGYDAIEGVTVTRQPRRCFVKLGVRD